MSRPETERFRSFLIDQAAIARAIHPRAEAKELAIMIAAACGAIGLVNTRGRRPAESSIRGLVRALQRGTPFELLVVSGWHAESGNLKS
jgi:hypothetical protein